MKWEITNKDDVAIVEMKTNKVNKQGPEFFSDLNSAFDILQKEYPNSAVVLTGGGSIFSAGLDFEYHFPLFARQDLNEMSQWYTNF